MRPRAAGPRAGFPAACCSRGATPCTVLLTSPPKPLPMHVPPTMHCVERKPAAHRTQGGQRGLALALKTLSRPFYLLVESLIAKQPFLSAVCWSKSRMVARGNTWYDGAEAARECSSPVQRLQMNLCRDAAVPESCRYKSPARVYCTHSPAPSQPQRWICSCAAPLASRREHRAPGALR
jgi:hypothetical protein